MRLYKCPKVLQYLVKEGLVDNREIWCYAQTKAQMIMEEGASPITIYGMSLVCVKETKLFIYEAAFNSTELALLYSCTIDEMKDVKITKKLASVRLSFSTSNAKFDLDLDDWKRFSVIF